MASSYFGGEKRLAGKAYRSGEMGNILTDIYADIDRAFTAAEAAIGYAPVRLATVAELEVGGTTYSEATGTGVLTAAANAALSVDGVPVVVGDRILVKNQTAAHDDFSNGIYVVTATGTGAAPFVLTRAADCKDQADITLNRTVLVTAGTTLASSAFRLSTAPADLGADPIEWTSIAVSAGLADGFFTAAKMKTDGTPGGLWTTDAFDLTVAAQLLAWKADGVDATAIEKILAADSLDFAAVATLAACKADSMDAAFFTKVAATDSFTVAVAADVIQDAAIVAAHLAAASVTGAKVAALVDDATAPQVEVLFSTALANLTGNEDIVVSLPAGQTFQITMAWVEQADVGDATNNYTLQKGAAAIGAPIGGTATDGAWLPLQAIPAANKANNSFVTGDTLRWAVVATAADAAGTGYVRMRRIA